MISIQAPMARRLVLGIAALAASAGVLAVVPLPLTTPPITAGTTNKVTSFAYDHPEFAPLTGGRKDATTLKFPHWKHLDPDAKASEKPDKSRLQCIDCHIPESDGRLMKPITFDAHCRMCHESLLGTVDDVAGSKYLPHAEPAVVGEALDNWMRQQIAISLATPKPPPTEGDAKSAESSGGGRRRGGAAAPEGPKKVAIPEIKSPEDMTAQLAKYRMDRFKSLSKANSKCAYCHSVEVSPNADKGEPFKVAKTNVPSTWLPRATFSHGSHEMVRCTECHVTAEHNNDASDINLPGIDSCRKCHSPEGRAGDSCVMCHVYHQKSDRPPSGKRSIDDLISDGHARRGAAPGMSAPAAITEPVKAAPEKK